MLPIKSEHTTFRVWVKKPDTGEGAMEAEERCLWWVPPSACFALCYRPQR